MWSQAGQCALADSAWADGLDLVFSGDPFHPQPSPGLVWFNLAAAGYADSRPWAG